MKENGRMIYSTVRVLKHGLTKADLRVNMLMVVNMVLELISGMMVVNTVETGAKTKSPE
jgi:hypothetical protein